MSLLLSALVFKEPSEEIDLTGRRKSIDFPDTRWIRKWLGGGWHEEHVHTSLNITPISKKNHRPFSPRSGTVFRNLFLIVRYSIDFYFFLTCTTFYAWERCSLEVMFAIPPNVYFNKNLPFPERSVPTRLDCGRYHSTPQLDWCNPPLGVNMEGETSDIGHVWAHLELLI